jgi:hypothetical protein
MSKGAALTLAKSLVNDKEVHVLVVLRGVLHLSLEIRPGVGTLLQASASELYGQTVHPYYANRTEFGLSKTQIFEIDRNEDSSLPVCFKTLTVGITRHLIFLSSRRRLTNSSR